MREGITGVEKMRTMIKDGIKISVRQHIITRNLWEFYVTTEPKGDVVNCLVLGFENEFGLVDLNEIRPHIISRTSDMNGVMPAPGWNWE